MKSRMLLALSLCFLWTGLASAQVTLEGKYPEGTKYSLQVEQKTTQKLNLAGMNFDTNSTFFSVETRSIGKRNSEGVLPVEYKVDTLQVDMSLPQGLSIKFDSAVPDPKANNPLLEPLIHTLRTTVRLPILVQVDSSNHIKSASFEEAEFEKLPEATKARFTPEILKKGVERETAYLPDQPVKVGDSWEKTLEIDVGEGQVLAFRNQYTYVGSVQQDGKPLDKIVSKTLDASYTVNGNPNLQVKNTDLKPKDSEGEYLFDRELGATSSRNSKVQVVGKLTLTIANMEFPGELDLTIEDKTVRQK